MSLPAPAVRSQDAPAFSQGFTAALLFAVTLNPINSSIIATALVSIARDFQVTAVHTALLVSALYLVSAVCQPLMGRLAARYGAWTVFMAGLILVAVGGVIGWAAPNITGLVVSRAVLGLGTSAAYPTAMMMIQLRAVQAGQPLPSAVLSLMAAAGHVTAAIGLPLGGLLIAAFGWRAAFALNVPLAALAILATLLWVPRAGLNAHNRRRPFAQHLDPLGLALFSGWVTALLVFLSDLTQPRWWALPVILGLTLALTVWERRQPSPFVDVRMLARNGALQRTYLRLLLTFTVMYGVLYGLSQWLEEAHHLTPGMVGLLLLPMSVLSAATSLLVGRRPLIRPLLLSTAVGILLGAAVLWVSGATQSVPWAVAAVAVFGLAMGLSNVGNQAMLYLSSPPAELGVTSGFYRTAGYLGGFIATGVIGLTFAGGAAPGSVLTFVAVFALLGAALLGLTLGDPAIPDQAPQGPGQHNG